MIRFILLQLIVFNFIISCEAEPKYTSCKVTRSVVQVYDGDTVKLDNGEKVRLIGYNTVEKGERTYFKFGLELANRLLGKSLCIQRFGTDKYNRTLGIVKNSNVCINAKMRSILKEQNVPDYDKYDKLLTKSQIKELKKCGWRR